MKEKVTRGISFPSAEQRDLAVARAKELGLSFSAYISQLVRKDLGLPSMLGGTNLRHYVSPVPATAAKHLKILHARQKRGLV